MSLSDSHVLQIFSCYYDFDSTCTCRASTCICVAIGTDILVGSLAGTPRPLPRGATTLSPYTIVIVGRVSTTTGTTLCCRTNRHTSVTQARAAHDHGISWAGGTEQRKEREREREREKERKRGGGKQAGGRAHREEYCKKGVEKHGTIE